MTTSNIVPAPSSTERDIILAGFYGQANFGDDLLAHYMLSHLTNGIEAKRIIVTAPEDSYLEKWFPGILALPRKKALASKSKKQRKVIFGGGGQFFAFPPTHLFNFFGATTCTSMRYWKLVPQLALGRARAYAFCVGAGPFAGSGARFATHILLNRFDAISVRDAVSQELLSEMGIKRVRLGADPSLGIALPTGMPSQLDDKGKSFGIVIRKWRHPPNTVPLIQELVKAAHSLRNTGWQIEFISFQGGYDCKIIGMLGEAGEPTRVWTPGNEQIDDFLSYLSGFRLLISMRAHGIFLAPQLGVIPIAVALEPKLNIAIKSSGYTHNILSTTATWDEIVHMVEDADKAGVIQSNVENQHQALAAETDLLLGWLST